MVYGFGEGKDGGEREVEEAAPKGSQFKFAQFNLKPIIVIVVGDCKEKRHFVYNKGNGLFKKKK